MECRWEDRCPESLESVRVKNDRLTEKARLFFRETQHLGASQRRKKCLRFAEVQPSFLVDKRAAVLPRVCVALDQLGKVWL